MTASSTGRIELLGEVLAAAARIEGAFIEGMHVAASGPAIIACDPSTGRQIASVPECEIATVDRAVQSAELAFRDGRWSKLRPADRERILLRFADLVESRIEELAQLESWNQGKSIHIARAVDAAGSVEFMRYYAGLATKITGQTFDVSIAVPPGARYTAYTRLEPVGVVAGITPWNFPLAIGIWKVMPALAAGCSILLKPSELTPLTTFRLAELALEAGIPPGVFNVVNGTGQVTGSALVSHPLIRKISFTGSTMAGKTIAKLASENVTRVSLELGGKNPAIVLSDADLAKVVPGLLMGGLFNSGQVCAAVSRIYVEKSLFGDLRDALAAGITTMALGPGLDPKAQVNPLVSAQHKARVEGHLSAAVAAGAQILTGADSPEEGFYVAPHLVIGADRRNPIQSEEVFGPVMSLTPVDSAEEAIALSNATQYGLAASLWTENLTQSLRIIPEIQAGTVWVNSHVPLDPAMPFGGVKQSGYGREFGTMALEPYLESKSVCIAH